MDITLKGTFATFQSIAGICSRDKKCNIQNSRLKNIFLDLNGTVVSWSFHSVAGGSFETTFTVPLIELVKNIYYILDGVDGTSINLWIISENILENG